MLFEDFHFQTCFQNIVTFQYLKCLFESIRLFCICLFLFFWVREFLSSTVFYRFIFLRRMFIQGVGLVVYRTTVFTQNLKHSPTFPIFHLACENRKFIGHHVIIFLISTFHTKYQLSLIIANNEYIVLIRFSTLPLNSRFILRQILLYLSNL